MDQKPESQAASDITELKESATKLAALSALSQSDAVLTKYFDPWARRIALYGTTGTVLYGLYAYVIVPNFNEVLLLLWQFLPAIMIFGHNKLPRSAIPVIGILICPLVSIISLCIVGFIFVRLYPTDPRSIHLCILFLATAIMWAWVGAIFLFISLIQTVLKVYDAVNGSTEITGQGFVAVKHVIGGIIGILERASQQPTSAQLVEETTKTPAISPPGGV
jgi:hypothetical protein